MREGKFGTCSRICYLIENNVDNGFLVINFGIKLVQTGERENLRFSSFTWVSIFFLRGSESGEREEWGGEGEHRWTAEEESVREVIIGT